VARNFVAILKGGFLNEFPGPRNSAKIHQIVLQVPSHSNHPALFMEGKQEQQKKNNKKYNL
jgi:hypothetical protein